jgi:DNA-binding CsgD family transcriptional regulator
VLGRWPLLGRDDEMQVMADALEAGEQRSVVIAGAAGVGKSSLARAFVDRAAAAGRPIAWAVATRSAATVPFGAVSHLIDQPHVLTTGRGDLLARATSALLASAGDEQLLVGIDDAHLLDDASAALVHQLAVAERAALIVTVRTGEPCPDPIVALWKDDLAARLELQALSAVETGRLLETVLEGPLDGRSRNLLWNSSLGNPLLLKELVIAGEQTGALRRADGLWRWEGPLRASDRLVELVEARVNRLADAERAALELLAVGEPLGVDVIASLGGREALDALDRQGLVRVEHAGRRRLLRVAHPLYSEAIRAIMRPLSAESARGRLAAALVEVGARRRDDLLRVATWQLHSRGPLGGAELLTAARRAALAYDHALALELGRAAIDAGAGPAATMLVADELFWLGRPTESDATLGALDLTQLDEDAQAEVAIMRSSARLWGLGQLDQALDGLVAAEQALPHGEARAAIAAHRASILFYAGLPAEAAQIVTAVLDDPSMGDLVRIRAAEAIGCFLGIGRPEHAIALAEQHIALALEHSEEFQPLAPAEIVGTQAFALWLAGRTGEADELATFLCREAEARHADDALGAVLFVSGRIILASGRVRSAIRRLSEASAALVAGDPTGFRSLSLACLAQGHAMLGDLGAAEAVLAESDAVRVRGLTPFEVDRWLARAKIAVRRGERTRAVELMSAGAAEAAEAGNRCTELFAWHEVARLGEAARCVDRVRELADGFEGTLAPAIMADVVARARSDGAALEEAAEGLARTGMFLLAAESAAEAHGLHRQAGRTGSALRSAALARQWASKCEGAADAIEGQLADSSRELARLTRREREVADLAGRGLSNRDIAESLSLSLRTVENHLAHAYEKLGVEGRAELGLLFRPGAPTSG